MNRSILAALAFSVLGASALAEPAPVHPVVRDLAKHETPLLLGTLEQLVNIESGSQDLVGLEKIAGLIEARLRQLGMQTEVLPGVISGPRTARTVDRVGSMVMGRLKGTGTRKIALIAHMDTVYQQGMLSKQPYRVDGDKTYGLAITDDKGGVAMILHTVAILQQLGFRDYAELTVLINADEEIGSPGSKARIAQLGQESDVVLSFEGTLVALGDDYVRLATSSLATATLKVVGRSAHAGSNPELGRNALYEMAHQILQSRDLSKPDKGLRLNWTLAKAGNVSNAIPDEAVAIGDARAFRAEDFVELEASLRERIRHTLIPETRVELSFEYERPPLVPTDASRKVAQQAVDIYAEIGRNLGVRERATGGGTDAAYAASQTRAAVLESFGLRGYGSHSSNAEYVLISSIEPRLYLTARLIMEISAGGKSATRHDSARDEPSRARSQ